MESALRGGVDVAKLNDWELAALVDGPVSEPEQLLAAAERLRELGARTAIVTRGEQPALVLGPDGVARQLVAPRLERGFREGCGDAMMGALAAVWARTPDDLDRALRYGAAAGAANFLRRGLGDASREVVERLLDSVRIERWDRGSAATVPK
jgi:1-phosphofructokinase